MNSFDYFTVNNLGHFFVRLDELLLHFGANNHIAAKQELVLNFGIPTI
jgi:hypothetical protein